MREPLEKNGLSTNTACYVCKEVIKLNARKCIHCDSYQDWRRFLGLGTTTLSLLVALFSVLGVAVPAIVSTFSAHEENIAASLLDVDPQEAVARILLSNLGDRTGGLRLVRVAFDDQEWELNLPYPDTIIQPGKAREMRAHSYRYLPELDLESGEARCYIKLSIVRFSGVERTEHVPYKCIIHPETGRFYDEASPTDSNQIN